MKFFKLAFLYGMLLLFSNCVNAQVMASGKDEIVTQSQTSITLNYTVPVGSDRLLLVSTGSDLNPLSVTYNGVAMTLESTSGGASLWTQTLGTDLAVGTTADIIFTIVGSTPAQYLALSALSCVGVDQATPIENITNQTIAGSATSSTITIASKPNDLVYDGIVIGCLGCFSEPIATKSLVETDLQNDLSFLGLGFAGAARSGTTPGAVSVSPGWEFSGSSITNGTHNGLNIRSSLPLPVELSSFSVQEQKENVLLEWETASEINNLGFEVERSTNGEDFQKIGFLPSRGTTSNNQYYQLLDLNPPKGILYFRLKQLDYDGRFEYSKVQAIELSQQEFSIFPNPAKNEIQVETYGLPITKVNILDQQGKLLMFVDIKDNQKIINLSDLSNGVFIISVTTADQVYTQKLVKIE